LCRSNFAQRIAFISAAANSFLRPHFSKVLIFLIMFLFPHATFAPRDTFLQAAANFLLDSQYPRVLSYRLWRRSAARLQTLRRPQSSDKHPSGLSLGDLWMLLYVLHQSWIGLSLYRSVAGGRLIQI
jgi:hypothetical protein